MLLPNTRVLNIQTLFYIKKGDAAKVWKCTNQIKCNQIQIYSTVWWLKWAASIKYKQCSCFSLRQPLCAGKPIVSLYIQLWSFKRKYSYTWAPSIDITYNHQTKTSITTHQRMVAIFIMIYIILMGIHLTTYIHRPIHIKWVWKYNY